MSLSCATTSFIELEHVSILQNEVLNFKCQPKLSELPILSWTLLAGIHRAWIKPCLEPKFLSSFPKFRPRRVQASIIRAQSLSRVFKPEPGLVPTLDRDKWSAWKWPRWGWVESTRPWNERLFSDEKFASKFFSDLRLICIKGVRGSFPEWGNQEREEQNRNVANKQSLTSEPLFLGWVV